MSSVKCDACSAVMSDWNIGEGNTLDLCESCKHVQRDLEKCHSAAREHPWGGVGAFDIVRTALTYRSLNSRIKKAGLKGKLSVLDIGFGVGLLLKKFIDRGDKCSGIEYELLELPHTKELEKNAALSFGSAEDTDFGKSRDLIYAIHVIEHLKDPQLVFEKCFNSLNNGGLLYFVTPNSESLGLKLFKTKWWNLEDPTHIRFFSKKSVTDMLTKAGFSDIKVKSPRWDSLTVEANSVLRVLSKSGKHGVMNEMLCKIATLLLSPAFFMIRVIIPSLSPSIEISAIKKDK